MCFVSLRTMRKEFGPFPPKKTLSSEVLSAINIVGVIRNQSTKPGGISAMLGLVPLTNINRWAQQG